MVDLRRSAAFGYALGVLTAKAIAKVTSALSGRRVAEAPAILSRTYLSTEDFEREARSLLGAGYKIMSVAGIPGHIDVVRAILDGRLTEMVQTSLGIRSPDRILVVYQQEAERSPSAELEPDLLSVPGDDSISRLLSVVVEMLQAPDTAAERHGAVVERLLGSDLPDHYVAAAHGLRMRLYAAQGDFERAKAAGNTARAMIADVMGLTGDDRTTYIERSPTKWPRVLQERVDGFLQTCWMDRPWLACVFNDNELSTVFPDAFREDLPDHERIDGALQSWRGFLGRAEGSYLFVGGVLFEQGRYDEAEEYFEALLDCQEAPLFAMIAATLLGLACRAKGDLVGAKRAWRRAREVVDRDPTTWRFMADGVGRPAYEHWQRLSERLVLDPEHPSPLALAPPRRALSGGRLPSSRAASAESGTRTRKVALVVVGFAVVLIGYSYLTQPPRRAVSPPPDRSISQPSTKSLRGPVGSPSPAAVGETEERVKLTELIQYAYFTGRIPSGGTHLTANTIPLRIDEFHVDINQTVVFFLALKKLGEGQTFQIKTRWYDEQNVERQVIETTMRQPGVKGEWTWTTHWVAMTKIAPYSGRWTVKVGVNETVVVESSFRLLGPAEPARSGTPHGEVQSDAGRARVIESFRAMCATRSYGSYGCFSLRFTDACNTDCAREVAKRLYSELSVPIRVISGAPLGPPGCIGYRADVGGTEEWAELILSILGEGYYIDNTKCTSDGFAINIRARPLEQ